MWFFFFFLVLSRRGNANQSDWQWSSSTLALLVAAEEGGCPEEHTGTKCETWRTLCAGRVAYTDPGPFAGAELVSFSPGTLGRGRAKALTDESDVLGNRAATALRLLPPPPDNGPPLDITALLTRAGPAT